MIPSIELRLAREIAGQVGLIVDAASASRAEEALREVRAASRYETPLICPYCRATVKRFIHHGAGGWVPTWRCATHGDVIPTEQG